MLKKSLPVVAAGLLGVGLLAGLLPPSSDVSAHSGQAAAELQAINAKLDAMVVPFKVVDTVGGLCDSGGVGTSTIDLEIDSDGTAGHFVVTSIMFLPDVPGVPQTGFDALSINYVEIDSERFWTHTGNVVGPSGQSGTYESFDLMGTPLRRTTDYANPVPGGNFPHQIVAESANTDDIHIAMFCSSADDDFSFNTIQVSGWKRPADTITLTFTPGS